ncbi:MAG: hypothetical protein EP332_06075 [Bacteroidetes bacterium]|nr:MAG: hypothetical protein EP332_06075 [Bacteroidota bacterium]
MKRLLFWFTAVGLGLSGNAQSAFKAGDFSASLGAQAFSAYGNGNMYEVTQMFKNSALFPADLGTYSESSFSSFNGSGIASLATSFYWKKKSQESHTPMRALRLGLSFFGSFATHHSFHKETETAIDTLYSTGGQAYPVDSFNFRSVNVNSISQNLVIDASLIFRTNSSKRWTLYSGFGVQAGLTMNSKAELSNIETTNIRIREGGNFQGESSTFNYRSEVQSIPNSFVGALYIPLGIDWQAGSKTEFFKQLHFFAEMRPTLLINKGLFSGMDMNPGLSGQFGVRIQFLNP